MADASAVTSLQLEGQRSSRASLDGTESISGLGSPRSFAGRVCVVLRHVLTDLGSSQLRDGAQLGEATLFPWLRSPSSRPAVPRLPPPLSRPSSVAKDSCD